MSLLLAGGLCLLPFLLPYHQQPVLSFFPEWLAAALGMAASLTLLVGRAAPAVALPGLARWLIVFAVFLAVQAASGGHAYSQLPLLAALYVLYAVLMIWLGAQLTAALGIERVAMVLAAFFLIGALANSLAGVIQFYGRPRLFEDVIAELRGNRAYGNIAQANLYANYLALGEGALYRILASPGEHAEPRRQAWLIALRAFIGAPLAGVGMGEFAGAAFELGLDPSLTRPGEVWTSPHNLPLHLLAETGLAGTVLVLGSLGVWGWQVARRYRTDREVALWWIIAAVGIEMIHSLTEFPLWNAHFLGLTALLMGAGARLEARSPAVSRTGWIAPAAACVALSVILGVTLRDYVRLDMTRISGTTPTLTPGAQAHQDAETMRELTHGLMAPLAELWIVIGAPLDRSTLADKLAMSERVARYWPANAVVTRRAAFLAFQGEAARARELLALVLKTFPHRRDATILTLEQARQADPDAIAPLIAMAKSPDIPPADLREQ